jgi:hypothetical protein
LALSRGRRTSHPDHLQHTKKPPRGWFVFMVEAAGIEHFVKSIKTTSYRVIVP